MTNTKTTKRALLASVLSVLMCISMLIGSTFAWFTDTASTGVNSIQAGTLDVQLVDPETGLSLEGKSISFVDKNGNTDILWEPGCTFITQPVRFVNNSNLSIEVETLITGFNGNLELLDVIEFKLYQYDITTGEVDFEEGDWNGRISAFQGFAFGTQTNGGRPVEMTDFVIWAHMDENASNNYQGLKLNSCSITIRARQMAQEFDSFGDQYDVNAAWPVSIKNTDELNAALNGDAESVTIDEGNFELPIQIPTNKELIVAGGNFSSDDKSGSALQVGEGSKLVVNAADISIEGYTTAVEVTGENASVELNGGVYKATGMQVINARKAGANVVINGGKYSGTWAVWADDGTSVVINGGEFNTAIIIGYDGTMDSSNITINGGYFKTNENWGNGVTGNNGANVTINGGTFTQDPSKDKCVTIGAGKTVVDNGNGTWTVQ